MKVRAILRSSLFSYAVTGIFLLASGVSSVSV